ncbi:portal protein [Cupriavidus metallidurans]|uniref:Portal protein n=1 Tax=Cupriavidus metallidurans TaxID=119219 RepID=A0A482ITD9_9BURK|nr:portal protein [Cupriavidus metallidurans]QBP10439.1 hypothetical protein DDF84_012085 [Cupriavidus metallidurans]QWC87513.1 hypothetical protein KB891_10635 [Cupriavidus metallidurans]
MARKRKDDGPDPIVKEAQERFQRCQEIEDEFRRRFVEDVKFANGDPDNGWQWPDQIRNSRDGDNRPCLTINKTRQHNLQIINDAKKNKPSIKTLPVDGAADVEVAKILDGIVRHIEYNSHAETVYDTATESAVEGGIGYWRVITDYAHDGSFEQEIFLRRIKDAMTVYLDPDIESADGADAKFGFVFEDITKTEFEAQYPGEEAKDVNFPLDRTGNSWIDKDKIRIAEYFRKAAKRDTLVNHPMRGPMLLSDLPEGAEKEALAASPDVQKRDVVVPEITWYKIAGNKVIDKKPWPGRYIPLVRVVGEERFIDGKIERKGHTRNLKDAQRMYNYMSSANVEFIALQTKTPFIAAAEAIEGYESEWSRANLDNLPYLPYNAFDEQGNPIQKPQREQPPVGAAAYLTGMQTAQQELMMASGQYQEQFGQPSNAQAGVAIQARQRQGDTATYHFIDNVARAIRYTGRILIDLIPKIYDTKRVLRIIGEDGTETFATLDPEQKQPVMMENGQPAPDEKGREGLDVQLIYNPGIGRYDVTVEVGPNFETRRQEAFNALTQIMSQDRDLMKVAGDLLFKAADFPMASDVAERLHRTIPPAILGEGPSPQEQDMQQKMTQMGQMIEHLSQMLQDAREGKDQQEVNIKEYDAETKRLQALGQPLDPQLVAHVATQVVMQMMETGMPADGSPPDPMQQQPNQAPPGAFFTSQPSPEQ